MFHFPFAALPPRHGNWRKSSASVSGNSSITGISQHMASTAGRWMADLADFPVATPEAIRLWDAVDGLLDGTLNQVALAIPQYERCPQPRGHDAPVLFDDGTGFDDDTGFEQARHGARIETRANRGAVEVSIRVLVGEMPQPGMYFSVRWRLYRVVKIISAVGNLATLKLWPPLRFPLLAGDTPDFAAPDCLMRLARDDAMSLDGGLQYGRWGQGSASFIEDTSEAV